MGAQIPVIAEKPLAVYWAVDQLADLFRTTHKVKTQQVVKCRGQHCGDLEPNPALNGKLTYPNNIDASLNKAANDKIRKYRPDYKNNPPNAVAFMPAIAGTTGRFHSEFIRLLFLQAHRETDRFFAASGVHSQRNQTWGHRTSTFAARLSLVC
jgi:hypothetical protein